jgi:hypothetical protein
MENAIEEFKKITDEIANTRVRLAHPVGKQNRQDVIDEAKRMENVELGLRKLISIFESQFQPPPTPELSEMLDKQQTFAEWASVNGWEYYIENKYWLRGGERIKCSTTELYDLFTKDQSK